MYCVIKWQQQRSMRRPAVTNWRRFFAVPEVEIWRRSWSAGKTEKCDAQPEI